MRKLRYDFDINEINHIEKAKKKAINLIDINYKFKKPFYGINCGSVGFLMNRYMTQKISEKINRSKISTIYPLQVQTIDKKRKKNS